MCSFYVGIYFLLRREQGCTYWHYFVGQHTRCSISIFAGACIWRTYNLYIYIYISTNISAWVPTDADSSSHTEPARLGKESFDLKVASDFQKEPGQVLLQAQQWLSVKLNARCVFNSHMQNAANLFRN